MKYCPNPQCPNMRRLRHPAEFLEHVTVCNDCGMALVARDALGTPETDQAVASFHEEKRRTAETHVEAGVRPEAAPGHLDIASGVALLGLSFGLFVVSFVAASVGGGKFIVAFGPMIYGAFRLTRGLEARRARKVDS
jgi:hypothetical protein